MEPSQVALVLRRIAAGIDASKNPKKDLVAKAIQEIVSRLAGDEEVAGDKSLEEMIGKSMDTLMFAVKKNDLDSFKRSFDQLAQRIEKL
jgi:hypothetical protein